MEESSPANQSGKFHLSLWERGREMRNDGLFVQKILSSYFIPNVLFLRHFTPCKNNSHLEASDSTIYNLFFFLFGGL